MTEFLPPPAGLGQTQAAPTSRMTTDQRVRMIFQICESLKGVEYLWKATNAAADVGLVISRIVTGGHPQNPEVIKPIGVWRNAFFAKALRKRNPALLEELVKEGIIKFV